MTDQHSPSVGDVILHHVTNDLGYKYLELNLFGLDISITKHVIMLWIVAGLTVSLAVWGTRRYRKDKQATPSGLSSLMEILMDFIRNDIVNPNIGAKYGRTWVPLITTYFVFILIANLIGLIPFFEKMPGGSATITGNFNTTLALALITFFAIIVAGIMKYGFIGHWKNLVPGGIPVVMVPLVLLIELLSMFVRPFALTMRLGANMTAGHIAMISIFALPILLQFAGAGIASILLNTGIYFLEIIVCFVQAYVFTLLSTVFIGMAIHADH